jgi:SagB-type dehydrogenase family enzyme
VTTASMQESPKKELHGLVDLLSDYECHHLLAIVSDVAAGQRFWEHDIGVLYNEYVKVRYFDMSRNLSGIVPAGPVYDDEPFVPIPLIKSYPDAARVSLPKPQESDVSVTDAIARRRSRRDYVMEPLTTAQLSSLLHYGAGTTGFARGYGYGRWPLRSFPSSGGLQVPEVYVAVRDVSGIDPGLYHYQPVDHALELLQPGHQNALLSAIGIGQPYIAAAGAVFAITGYYARANWKYGERAFRYMCMDVGFLAENLCLVAEALGLGACAVAGFIDDALERMLGLDPHDEMALLMLTLGAMSPNARVDDQTDNEPTTQG